MGDAHALISTATKSAPVLPFAAFGHMEATTPATNTLEPDGTGALMGYEATCRAGGEPEARNGGIEEMRGNLHSGVGDGSKERGHRCGMTHPAWGRGEGEDAERGCLQKDQEGRRILLSQSRDTLKSTFHTNYAEFTQIMGHPHKPGHLLLPY